MNRKNLVIAIISVIVLGSAVFYGGVKYDQNSLSASAKNARGNFQGGGGAGMMVNGSRNFARGANGQSITSGDIIAKDASTITVKLRDGSSKIVLYSGSTQIAKMASGTPSDLSTGTSVSIIGSDNKDGSITSESIQIRPNMGARPTNPTQN